MRTILILTITSFFFSFLAGCAHHLMRGSVAMKTSENEAHVCMGESEVKVGDKVTLFRNNCPPRAGRGSGRTCEKVKLGKGTVTQVINEHYSAVTFDPGVPFEEGTFVEKL